MRRFDQQIVTILITINAIAALVLNVVANGHVELARAQ